MKKHQVVLSKSAEKNLYMLPLKAIEKIVPVLVDLEDNPSPRGCKKLQGFTNLWRVRIGDYRAKYSIEEVISIVDVREIGHRQGIYE